MKIKKFIFPCICFALLSAFVFLMISAALNIKVSVSSESVKSMPTIVIDAGHGGEDGGAV